MLYRRISVFIGLGLSLLACSHLETDFQQPVRKELTFTAIQEVYQTQTKTERQVGGENDGENFWLPGDAVSLFFNSGTNGGNKFVAQNQEIARIAEFKGTIDSFAGGGENATNGYYFWAVYPYSDDVECDGESVILTLPDSQVGKVGSYSSGIFPTMAKEKGLELGFHSIGCGLKFTVRKDNIKAVKFQGNNGEKIAGKVKVIWGTDGHPEVNDYIEGKQAITVSAPNGGTFIPGAEYYIVFLPGSYSAGFSLTYFTTDGKQGTYSYTKSRTFNRNIFTGGAREWDLNVSEWTDAEGKTPGSEELEEGGTESGLYLGLTYFGSSLSSYPIQLLTEESLSGFNAFIDERTDLDDETLLYYSVDKSMNRLKSCRLPDDLFSVAIVTFTDGQDDGSVGWKEDETGRTYYKGDYERELAEILRGTVNNNSVMAYSVGLQQVGITSNTAFISSLQTIAHPSTNYSLANSMTEVNERFKYIAQELSNTIKLQKINGTIPRQATGTKIRFTYDNTNSGAGSTLYIEGEYYSTDYSLRNIVYCGLTSSSGATVVGVRKNNKVTFTFEGIHRENNADVSMDYFKRWIYNADTSEWEEYIETSFQPGENGIKRELKSAAILLNIDCTESLGEYNFSLLKQYSKGFINTLFSSSIDPDAVYSIKLNKTSLDLVIGESEKLNGTVYPSTAIDKSVTWSSSNELVASVDANGNIKALSLGSSIVTATTTDGEKKAQCQVIVKASRPVQSVSLDKSTVSLQIGKTLQLNAIVLPLNATDRGLEWISTDETVVSVSSTGLLSGVGIGHATISAVSIDGSQCFASCEVSVTLPTSPSVLALAIESSTGNKYYITQELYQSVDISGFTKRGIVCGPISGSYFILTMKDYSATYHISGSQGLYNTVYNFSASSANSGSRLLPNKSQAEWLCTNMQTVNSAMITFGGTSMLTTVDYWTSDYRGDRFYYYYRYGTGVSLDNTGEKKCNVREIKSL